MIKTKGLLWYLVSYFCSHYVTHEAGTQTEFDATLNKASLGYLILEKKTPNKVKLISN